LRKSKNISGKYFSACFGILLALFVLTQAVYVPMQVADSYEQQGTSDTEDDTQEPQQLTKTAALPSSLLQLNLGYQSYLLNEVFFFLEDEEKPTTFKQILPATQKALKILFQRIISPNAP